eukprot:CAMPEP_0171090040 /NCGR_PEP_ID=MMETSP0766_2-20121228/28424_1 /TAXON_ID=439317 /ORGANISM="Gambierdiscus australes, Strain CAWD 149" /LENGTH=70 /DNA_ID=CAMNT_0011547983 /DNA_START=57 /DNA_END=269 /DNA_ORIENTATION=+
MPMTKIQAVKKELLAGLISGNPDVEAEAAKMLASLAKAKRLGTIDAELADLAKRMPAATKSEAVKDEEAL